MMEQINTSKDLLTEAQQASRESLDEIQANIFHRRIMLNSKLTWKDHMLLYMLASFGRNAEGVVDDMLSDVVATRDLLVNADKDRSDVLLTDDTGLVVFGPMNKRPLLPIKVPKSGNDVFETSIRAPFGAGSVVVSQDSNKPSGRIVERAPFWVERHQWHQLPYESEPGTDVNGVHSYRNLLIGRDAIMGWVADQAPENVQANFHTALGIRLGKIEPSQLNQ